jgi:hypothetical protein
MFTLCMDACAVAMCSGDEALAHARPTTPDSEPRLGYSLVPFRRWRQVGHGHLTR